MDCFFVAGWPIVGVFIKLPIVFWAGFSWLWPISFDTVADLICRPRPIYLVILPISVGVSASFADLICSRRVMLMLLLTWTQHWLKCFVADLGWAGVGVCFSCHRSGFGISVEISLVIGSVLDRAAALFG
ncbi:hypothetical protein Nepgr_031750 [Nepenthes gracilis]|uniref:Uncharacterized protein n=1 Tax=Nepenthes gracilis TaxID=150966 RepID=A0AAD3Y537_NEPGR|nr:hypothetical protein Nepgr_031750 [Nepenthes gracilis]